MVDPIPDLRHDPERAPFDDYVDPRCSFVHEAPRAKKSGVLLMLAVLSLMASGFALASRPPKAPLSGTRPAVAGEAQTAEALTTEPAAALPPTR